MSNCWCFEIDKVVDTLYKTSDLFDCDLKTGWTIYTHDIITNQYTWEQIENYIKENGRDNMRNFKLYQIDMAILKDSIADGYLLDTDEANMYTDVKMFASLNKPIDNIKEIFPKLYTLVKEFDESLINDYFKDKLQNETDPIQIKDICFTMFNVGHQKYREGLLYSMTSGDILQVDDEYFMCMGIGWNKIDL